MRDTTPKTQKKHNTENKKDGQHEPHQKPGVNSGAGEGWAVSASYNIPVVLLICIVKSDKSLVGDRGMTKST